MTSLVNSSAHPYSTVVRLEVTFPNGQAASGSGVVVSQNDILTASHMVWQAEYGGAASSISIVPAQNGASEPYGHFAGVRFDYYELDREGSGGLSQSESSSDVAVIGTREPIYMTTGVMELDPNFTAGVLSATGYPGIYGGFSMTTDSGFVFAESGGTLNTSLIELNPGNSGGPLWYSGGGSPHVVGVVSTGGHGFDVGSKYSQILSWLESNNDLVTSGTSGNDVLAGSPSADRIMLGFGSDTYNGAAGNDVIYGNQGTDNLAGGSGNDTMFGGQNDGPAGTDGMLRQGVDTVDGADGNDIIYGNYGADMLTGGNGDDVMYGGQNNDTISGGAGSDTLIGNLHDDLLIGGSGADLFVLNGNDTISDFSEAEGDRIQGAAAAMSLQSDGMIVITNTGSTVKLLGIISVSASDFEIA